jgi:inosine/xanthosine triphosphate pyrophosphatase family protein
VQIILATTNPAKAQALAERVGPDLVVEPLPSPALAGHIPDEADFGSTYTEIAAAKAVWYSRHIPKQFITASDGGLLVPSLKGRWEPIHTARYAGVSAGREASVGALLERARHLRAGDRRIGWMEALAVARDGELLASWVAKSPPGELATRLPPDFDPTAGFWVPYIWRCPEYGGRLLSELTDYERLARRDHWAILGECLTDWARDQPPTGPNRELQSN